jgi:hypothetical protein
MDRFIGRHEVYAVAPTRQSFTCGQQHYAIGSLNDSRRQDTGQCLHSKERGESSLSAGRLLIGQDSRTFARPDVGVELAQASGRCGNEVCAAASPALKQSFRKPGI